MPNLPYYGFGGEYFTVFERSIDGATAVLALVKDTKFLVGSKHHQTTAGPLLDECTYKSVLVISFKGHNQKGDNTHYDVWQHLRSWGMRYETSKSRHFIYTDLPLIAKTLGVNYPFFIDDDLIHGTKALHDVWKYTATFLDHSSRDKGDGVASRPSSVFQVVGPQTWAHAAKS